MTDDLEREQMRDRVRQLDALGELEEKSAELVLQIVAGQLAEELLRRFGNPAGDFPPEWENTFNLSGRVTQEELNGMISQSEAWRLLWLSIMKIQGDSEWLAGRITGEKR
jgi:hypothetical protein